MLASRVLPPIVRPPSPPSQAPVATFFNVPRRYVRSNMQVGDTPLSPATDDAKSSRSLRKSSRLHDTRPSPSSGPQTKDEESPSPIVDSPQSAKKRLATVEEEVVNGEESVHRNNATGINSPPVTPATNGSGESSPHVCLCQPEPKIPRPRNGKSFGPILCLRTCYFQKGWCDLR